MASCDFLVQCQLVHTIMPLGCKDVYPTPPSPTSATREPGWENCCTMFAKASRLMKSGSRGKGTVDDGHGFGSTKSTVSFESHFL
jgi:hypothetical protein